ncbi:hypothetical protein [Amycolatopsis methanolica]|uniref:hypothetical protein n=1 Tax=Amycolatopsis methanolica TaxID=1814 RepID=UPI0003A824F7|nr:hypothetical protein [Amycolatopsis methanolica]
MNGPQQTSQTDPARRAAVGLARTATVGTASAATSAAACSDLEIVFARGSGEAPGLGITGTPLVSDVKSALSSA